MRPRSTECTSAGTSGASAVAAGRGWRQYPRNAAADSPPPAPSTSQSRGWIPARSHAAASSRTVSRQVPLRSRRSSPGVRTRWPTSRQLAGGLLCRTARRRNASARAATTWSMRAGSAGEPGRSGLPVRSASSATASSSSVPTAGSCGCTCAASSSTASGASVASHWPAASTWTGRRRCASVRPPAHSSARTQPGRRSGTASMTSGSRVGPTSPASTVVPADRSTGGAIGPSASETVSRTVAEGRSASVVNASREMTGTAQEASGAPRTGIAASSMEIGAAAGTGVDPVPGCRSAVSPMLSVYRLGGCAPDRLGGPVRCL